MIPRLSPAKIATSAPSASPGPLTTQPMTATLMGSSMSLGEFPDARLARGVNRSTWMRPHVGHAMSSAALAFAQAEDVEHLQRVFDLVGGVAGVADTHGVADAVGEQRARAGRHERIVAGLARVRRG